MKTKFVICIRNDDYPASIEKRKLYQTLDDPEAAKHGQIRVIDESGEDYLYPQEYFVPIHLPAETEKVLIQAFCSQHAPAIRR